MEVNTLKGAAGATGPAGPAGATGANPASRGRERRPGPYRPLERVLRLERNATVLGAAKTVMSLTLQPGADRVSKKVWAYSTSTVTPPHVLRADHHVLVLATDHTGGVISPSFSGTLG